MLRNGLGSYLYQAPEVEYALRVWPTLLLIVCDSMRLCYTTLSYHLRQGQLLPCLLQMLKRQRYGDKVDVYALGCILYELFTRDLRARQVCSPTKEHSPEELKIYALKVLNTFYAHTSFTKACGLGSGHVSHYGMPVSQLHVRQHPTDIISQSL